MNLSEFANLHKDDIAKTYNTKSENGEGGIPEQDMVAMYENMKNMSAEDLYGALKMEVQKQKANNSFDYEGLLNSLDAIKNYLPQESYENMIRIIDELNGKN